MNETATLADQLSDRCAHVIGSGALDYLLDEIPAALRAATSAPALSYATVGTVLGMERFVENPDNGKLFVAFLSEIDTPNGTLYPSAYFELSHEEAESALQSEDSAVADFLAPMLRSLISEIVKEAA
jgi:hypothetical protein